jgi:signal transduction histidine kinase
LAERGDGTPDETGYQPLAARGAPGSGPRIAEFTELAATAISNAEAQAQLRDSRARVVASADEVRDDGRGGADLTGGAGLVGIKDRAEALGGRLYPDSPPDGGTVLRADFPLTATRPARRSAG